MHEEKLKEIHGNLSLEFQAKYPAAKQGLRILDSLLKQVRASDVPIYETPFLLNFAAHDVGYTRALCAAIVAHASSGLSGSFHFFLNAVEAVQPHSVLRLAQKAVATRNETLCASAARHLDWMARTRGLSKGELPLLKQLAKNSNVLVASNAISAIGVVGIENPAEGTRLLLATNWEHDSHLASAAMQCIDAQFGIPPDKLSPANFRRILNRLVVTPNVENHEIGEFIGHASSRCPDDVVRLFVNRIKRSLKMKSDLNERPIPYEFHHPMPDLSKYSSGVTQLREVRDLMLRRKWQYHHFARELYWSLAPVGFCLDLLKEWIESPDDAHFKAALSLMSESGSDFVFSRPDYVEFVLTKAQSHSTERLDHAESGLLFCATRHGESRSVGQPGPTTVATKERATDLATKYPVGSLMAEFYQSIIKRSDARLADEKLRDEELLEGE